MIILKRKAKWNESWSLKTKTCSKLNEDLLTELIESDMFSSSNKWKVKLWDMFICNDAGAVVCTVCSMANAAENFRQDKITKMENWLLKEVSQSETTLRISQS